MIQKTVKRSGQTYTLICEGYDKDTRLCLDGVYAEKVYFNSKYNMYYAPFETKDGAYWMMVYNRKLYFTKAIHGTSEEDFSRDVAKSAFSFPLAFLFLTLAYLIPIIVAMTLSMVVTKQDGDIFVVLATCGMMIFSLFNLFPVASIPVRRKLSMFSLIAVLLSWAIFLLNYWAIS